VRFCASWVKSGNQASIHSSDNREIALRVNWRNVGNDKLRGEEREALQQRSVGLAKLLLSPGRGVRVHWCRWLTPPAQAIAFKQERGIL
jgi:hypothetical protein